MAQKWVIGQYHEIDCADSSDLAHSDCLQCHLASS